MMAANCFTPETLKSAPLTKSGTPRKHSYYNHPVSIWMRESSANFEWALEHAIELENERLYRNYKPHFSFTFIDWVVSSISKSIVPTSKLTPFAVAISEDKKCRNIKGFENMSPIEQYRLYYKYDKPFAKWTKREIPDWFNKL